MAIDTFKVKIKQPVSGGGFNGNSSVNIFTDSEAKALAFGQGIVPFLANMARVGVSKDILAMDTNPLPASGTYTDVRVYYFNLKSARRRTRIYLPLAPSANIDDVVTLIETNFVDTGADGTGTSAVKVESFGMKGQNVISGGTYQPPANTIV